MKHSRLQNLRKYKEFHVPHFFVYSWNLDKLQELKTEKIILRSSYEQEDGGENSFAWIFTSVLIENKNIQEIHIWIQKILWDAEIKLKQIWWDIRDFHIFIQEYVEISMWWVAFLEEDKIYVELSRQGSYGVVNGEVDQTIFEQLTLCIETWETLVGKKSWNSLKNTLKLIQSYHDFSVDIEFGISEKWQIYIFQVRPITRSIFQELNLLDNSNIGENFPGQTSKLTYSFVKKLYSDVYRSTAFHSWISFEKISKIWHIFDNLVAQKDGEIYYNIANWYRMLLLFPGDHKKSFDAMIWSSGNIRYLQIDSLRWLLPTCIYTLKYICIVIKKIFTFYKNLHALEKYLDNFYKDFFSKDISSYSTEKLATMLTEFMQDLSYLWYVTIDNDFLIMKFSWGKNLQEIHGLYSTQQLSYLKKLANKEISFDTYKGIYGHRFWDELKLENREFDYASDEFQKILEKYKNLEFPNTYQKKKSFLNFLINNREKFRVFRSKNFHIASIIFREIAKKFHEKKIISHEDEIFGFTIEEVFNLIQNEGRILSKNYEKILIWNEFEWIVYIMEEFHIPKMKYDIIVAKTFDPWWTIFLWWIQGIIIENGNLLSHISIISREMNLPLLMGAQGIIDKIKNGDRIRVTKNWEVLILKNTTYEQL